MKTILHQSSNEGEALELFRSLSTQPGCPALGVTNGAGLMPAGARSGAGKLGVVKGAPGGDCVLVTRCSAETLTLGLTALQRSMV